MRYFLVTYVGKPSGSMDELVTVSKNTRKRDLQTCSVILDFRTRSVVKCSIGEQVGVRDFATIRDFYHPHYTRIIEDLEKVYEKSNTVS